MIGTGEKPNTVFTVLQFGNYRYFVGLGFPSWGNCIVDISSI